MNKAESDHTHSYLPLSGGTITGKTKIEAASSAGLVLHRTDEGYHAGIEFTNPSGVDGRLSMSSDYVLWYRGVDGVADTTNGIILLDDENYSNYALPLTGGTLKSTAFAILTLDRNSEGRIPGLRFINSLSDTFYGTVSLNANHHIRIYTDASSVESASYMVLDTGNVQSYALAYDAFTSITDDLTDLFANQYNVNSTDKIAVGLYRVNANTLNSAYATGASGYAGGLVLNFSSSQNYGTQMSITSGSGPMFRFKQGSTTPTDWTPWFLPLACSSWPLKNNSFWQYNSYGRIYTSESALQLESHSVNDRTTANRTLLIVYNARSIDTALRFLRYDENSEYTVYDVFGDHNGNVCKIVSSSPSKTSALWAY